MSRQQPSRFIEHAMNADDRAEGRARQTQAWISAFSKNPRRRIASCSSSAMETLFQGHRRCAAEP